LNVFPDGGFMLALSHFRDHILPNGDRDPAWPAFGLPPCTAVGIQSDLVAVEDGQGGAFVCWLDQRVPTPANQVTRVLASGLVAPGSPADGLLMAPTLTNGHRPPRAVLDGMGGMVAVWEHEYSPRTWTSPERASCSTARSHGTSR
jgi:hypothetical protein